jgi:hypothetical protein
MSARWTTFIGTVALVISIYGTASVVQAYAATNLSCTPTPAATFDYPFGPDGSYAISPDDSPRADSWWRIQTFERDPNSLQCIDNGHLGEDWRRIGKPTAHSPHRSLS